MKKLKINSLKEKLEVLTREQLKLIAGGYGGDDPCQGHGSPCDTSIQLNCCNNLVCVVKDGKKVCLDATL